MFSLFAPFDMKFSMFQFALIFLFSMLTMEKLYKISIKSSLLNKFFFEFNLLMGTMKMGGWMKMTPIFFMGISMSLFYLNFCSIFPYVFPISTQVSTVLSLSISIWFSLTMFNIFYCIKGFLSHFIPEGAPKLLTLILFLIEIVSSIIRPITLSVRLMANILSGHLLMILLSKMVFLIPLLSPLYMGLNMVEIFVGVIQSYIFITLTMLYMAELG